MLLGHFSMPTFCELLVLFDNQQNARFEIWKSFNNAGDLMTVDAVAYIPAFGPSLNVDVNVCVESESDDVDNELIWKRWGLIGLLRRHYFHVQLLYWDWLVRCGVRCIRKFEFVGSN